MNIAGNIALLQQDDKQLIYSGIMEIGELAKRLCLIAERAGDEILDLKSNRGYGDVDIKVDGSPVTIADKRAHSIICESILGWLPGIPIVSEEGLIGNPTNSELSFVVDPLDGTKEFIKDNGMYTVNIALAEKNEASRWKPIFGVVVAPATGTTWFGGRDVKATKKRLNSVEEIKIRSKSELPTVLGSVSHPSPKDKRFRDDLGEHTFEGVGSSIKICRVADGTADLTARFGPTSCWDTAAAHAILNAAGGHILDPNGGELDYDIVNDWLNPPFLATGDTKWIDIWMRHNNDHF